MMMGVRETRTDNHGVIVGQRIGPVAQVAAVVAAVGAVVVAVVLLVGCYQVDQAAHVVCGLGPGRAGKAQQQADHLARPPAQAHTGLHQEVHEASFGVMHAPFTLMVTI